MLVGDELIIHRFIYQSYIKVVGGVVEGQPLFHEEQREEHGEEHTKYHDNRVPDAKYSRKEHPISHEEHANSRRRTPKQAQLS